MREQIDWKQELLDSANFNGKKEKDIEGWSKIIN